METRGPKSPAVTISTVWLDPRRLVPCNEPRDPAVIKILIAAFQIGAGASVEPILAMPLVPDERKLLVLHGNHRAGAALAADRRLLGKLCRTIEELETVGQGNAALEARRQGFAGCRESFRAFAVQNGWYAGGFRLFLERTGLIAP
jgi:hypothetical protein